MHVQLLRLLTTNCATKLTSACTPMHALQLHVRMDDALLRVTVLQCIEYSIGHAVVLYTVQHYMKTE